MGRKCCKIFVRSFSAAVQRDSAGFVKNREEFFKKSLEFLRETDIESNRFFARRGKAPDCPPVNKGP